MENIGLTTKDVSVTRIAGLYVVCLLLGGLAIFGTANFAGSHVILFASLAAGIVAAGGAIYSVRLVFAALQK